MSASWFHIEETLSTFIASVRDLLLKHFQLILSEAEGCWLAEDVSGCLWLLLLLYTQRLMMPSSALVKTTK